MTLISSLVSGRETLQFKLLLDCPELHHAILLKPIEIQKPFYELEQIHSNIILKTPPDRPADGMIASSKEDRLLIKHADCQAAIFYDPMTQSLACVHAGWRGLVANIYTEAVIRLKSEKGVDPANLLCAIGPSLGPEKAEFIGWREYFPESFGEFEIKENHFDLRGIARRELMSLGLLSHHIEIAEECTYSDASRFYSWRRDKTSSRHATVASLISIF